MSAKRSAIVTGGSAGIGLAVARMLAGEGWALTLVGRAPERLAAAAAQLGDAVEVRTVSANLADPEAAAGLGADHVAHFGGVDLLVNNAGVGLIGPIATKTPKQLDLELNLNFKSAYLLLQACVPALIESAAERGASYVVNVSSLAARENPPNGSTYASMKAALVSLSNVAHAELSRHGVHVTALLPGLVDTPGTAWAGEGLRDTMMTADDVAEAVRFLLRTSARCYVPEIMLTTAGPGVWHSPVDWDAVAT
ncbi:SDR family oxidoreductase [Actinocorallia sp. A-T 12471]|uniref:SDR family NAD(P)-dependent oxidoreductase n=1 Tax=Actinocorallia sp. A-T 12471 TaxID=3089813 RepID=UPI0029CB8C21|nr:SDR family oxidoreductase [Actinocorallia sp. A-T 12471]MDX6741681.1 SDR family oxidoreductase [Actinocorallia sp. A-T 12471]